MKKFVQIILILFLLTQPCFAITNPLSNFFNDERAIRNLLESQIRQANRSNYNKYLSYFDKNYKNYDGFDLNTYSDLIKDVWASYQKVRYDIKIDKITVDKDKASVDLHEYTNAKIFDKNLDGELKSVSDSTYYLTKNNKKWRIYSDKTLSESTYMLYGSAKNLDIDLITPNNVPANSEYCVSLAFVPPKDTIAIASIAVDMVEYPQKQTEEVFRAFPEDNLLERLFTANDKNLDGT